MYCEPPPAVTASHYKPTPDLTCQTPVDSRLRDEAVDEAAGQLQHAELLVDNSASRKLDRDFFTEVRVTRNIQPYFSSKAVVVLMLRDCGINAVWLLHACHIIVHNSDPVNLVHMLLCVLDIVGVIYCALW